MNIYISFTFGFELKELYNLNSLDNLYLFNPILITNRNMY